MFHFVNFARRFQTTSGSRLILNACLIGLALFALLSLARTIGRTFGPLGGLDFHPFWYAGHFIRQGANPYDAFLQRQSPALPVRYLDGVIVETGQVAQRGLTRIPTNTAPLLLWLTPFSFFSWPTAKVLWLACNLLLAAVIPWLGLRLLPEGGREWPLSNRLLVALIFYALAGPRVAAWLGQSSLLVFSLMLVTLLAYRQRPWLAGLLLGLALSKYSLALPVFLFLLLERRWRPVVISLVVQAAGVLLMAFISGDSPLFIGQNYVDIFRIVAGLELESSIHLGRWLPGEGWVTPAVLAAGTAIVWGFLIRAYRRKDPARITQLHLFVILLLWTLLVAYHAIYDSLTAILFVILVVHGLRRPEVWQLSRRGRLGLAAFLAVVVGILCLPGEIAGVVLPEAWLAVWLVTADALVTAALVAMLAVSLWLLRLAFRQHCCR